MGRGPSRYSESDLIIEIYEVLIKKGKLSKVFSKRELQWHLRNPEIALRVLQLCLEHDIKSNMLDFKKGLMLTIKEHGVDSIAKKAKINRVSLYRMLSPTGNPEMKTLMRLLKALDLKMWLVSDDFATPYRRPRLSLNMPPDIFDYLKKGE